MTYAIIKVAGKQYRVREGERLLVDRLAQDDGATITPTVLLVGGDGAPVLEPDGVKVTATVLEAVKGPKFESELHVSHTTGGGTGTNSSKTTRYDDGMIRSEAYQVGIPCVTTLSAGMAAVQGIRALRGGKAEVASLQDYFAAPRTGKAAAAAARQA